MTAFAQPRVRRRRAARLEAAVVEVALECRRLVRGEGKARRRAVAEPARAQEYAESGPRLETVSRALTTNVWRPSARSLYTCGEPQAANAASSSLHSKVACSLAAKAKLAARLLVGSPGFCVIAAAGPIVSIVHV